MRRKSGHARIDAFKGVVIGSDEAGYGCWAGPLVVCAASAPIGWDDVRVRDSKQVDDGLRGRLHDEFVQDERFPHCVITVKPEDIDRLGVYQALFLAHQEALRRVFQQLGAEPLGVVDGTLQVHKMSLGFPVLPLPKADQLVPECALASIIAKTTQCRRMAELEREFPGYGFGQHNGYGTPEHQEALDRLGPCAAHRRSYRSVRAVIERLERDAEPKELWTYFDDEG